MENKISSADTERQVISEINLVLETLEDICQKRMSKELQRLTTENYFINDLILIYPFLGKVKAIILGPKLTPYEDGLFLLDIVLTKSYPIEKPKVRFLTPILNPYISQSGQIYVEIIDNSAPVTGIFNYILSIAAILDNSLQGSPCCNKTFYLDNRKLFEEEARNLTLAQAFKDLPPEFEKSDFLRYLFINNPSNLIVRKLTDEGIWDPDQKKFVQYKRNVPG